MRHCHVPSSCRRAPCCGRPSQCRRWLRVSSSDFVEPARWPDWAGPLSRADAVSRIRPRASVHAPGEMAGPAGFRLRTRRRDGRADAAHLGHAGQHGDHRPRETVCARRSRRRSTIRSSAPAHLPLMERTDVVNPLLIGFLRSAVPRDAPSEARRVHRCSVRRPRRRQIIATARGRKTEKRLPLPGVLLARMTPPVCSTIPCAVERPSPVPTPAGFVVTNGSKRYGSTAGSIPVPVSST